MRVCLLWSAGLCKREHSLEEPQLGVQAVAGRGAGGQNAKQQQRLEAERAEQQGDR